MSENMIACWVFLVVGIILVIMSLYHFVRMVSDKDAEYRIIPGTLFCVIGGVLVLSSAAHWNDDLEYKIIECKEYKIEEVTVTNCDSQIVEKTYKISYR